MHILKLQMIFELDHPNGREYPNEGGIGNLACKQHNQGQSIVRN